MVLVLTHRKIINIIKLAKFAKENIIFHFHAKKLYLLLSVYAKLKIIDRYSALLVISLDHKH